MNSRLALVATLLVLAACAASTEPPPNTQPTDANVSVSGDTLRIPLGAQAMTQGGRVRVAFLERVGDSRCPTNVVCVWAGDAEVRVRVHAGGKELVARIHTTVEPQVVTFEGYALRLVGLTPYPGSGDQQATPVAYVTVSREK